MLCTSPHTKYLFFQMSNITSPQRFSGTGTFDHFYDGHYEPDLSTQMKVPKRIRVTGKVVRTRKGKWSGEI